MLLSEGLETPTILAHQFSVVGVVQLYNSDSFPLRCPPLPHFLLFPYLFLVPECWVLPPSVRLAFIRIQLAAAAAGSEKTINTMVNHRHRNY